MPTFRRAPVPVLPEAIEHLLKTGEIPAAGIPGRCAAFRLMGRTAELRALWLEHSARLLEDWGDDDESCWAENVFGAED